MKTEGLSFSEAIDLLELESQRIAIDGADYVVGIQKGKYPINGQAVEDIDGIALKHFEFGEEDCEVVLPQIFSQIGPHKFFVPVRNTLLLSHNWRLVKE